jgi:hypothetical protein
MDAQFQNNLARGLGAVADTFGKYAMAAHEERLQAAKQQFTQMLEDKRQSAEDARSSSLEAQRAADRAQEKALAAQQHKADKEQQDAQFNARLKQEAAQHDETNARITASESEANADRAATLKLAQERAAREANPSNTPPTQAQLLARVEFTDKALKPAADAFSTMTADTPKDEQIRAGTAYGRALADSNKARAAAGLQPQVPITVGAHAGATPATPAAPAAPAYTPLKKAVVNGQTQFMIQQGNQWVPTTIENAAKINQQNKLATPPTNAGADASAPTSSVPDTSDSSAPQPGAASTAGDYAQAQNDPSQQAPAPPAAAPVVGQPDPNNPTLAS